MECVCLTRLLQGTEWVLTHPPLEDHVWSIGIGWKRATHKLAVIDFDYHTHSNITKLDSNKR